MFLIDTIIKAGGEAFKTWNDGRIRIKEAKIQTKIKKIEAAGRIADKEADERKDWDMEALKASKNSLKDEIIMIIWLAPFVMLFIPDTQPYVKEGFSHLAEVPYGYWLVLFGIVAQAFGLRWLFSKRIDKAIDSVKAGEK